MKITDEAQNQTAMALLDRLFAAPELDMRQIEEVSNAITEYQFASETSPLIILDPVDMIAQAIMVGFRTKEDLDKIVCDDALVTDFFLRKRFLPDAMISEIGIAWGIPLNLLRISYDLET